jgi:hypothetical protein
VYILTPTPIDVFESISPATLIREIFDRFCIQFFSVIIGAEKEITRKRNILRYDLFKLLQKYFLIVIVLWPDCFTIFHCFAIKMETSFLLSKIIAVQLKKLFLFNKGEGMSTFNTPELILVEFRPPFFLWSELFRYSGSKISKSISIQEFFCHLFSTFKKSPQKGSFWTKIGLVHWYNNTRVLKLQSAYFDFMYWNHNFLLSLFQQKYVKQLWNVNLCITLLWYIQNKFKWTREMLLQNRP